MLVRGGGVEAEALAGGQGFSLLPRYWVRHARNNEAFRSEGFGKPSGGTAVGV